MGDDSCTESFYSWQSSQNCRFLYFPNFYYFIWSQFLLKNISTRTSSHYTQKNLQGQENFRAQQQWQCLTKNHLSKRHGASISHRATIIGHTRDPVQKIIHTMDEQVSQVLWSLGQVYLCKEFMTSFLSIISGPPTLTFHKPNFSVIPLSTRHFLHICSGQQQMFSFSSLKKNPSTLQKRKEKNILPHPYNKDYSRSRSRKKGFCPHLLSSP